MHPSLLPPNSFPLERALEAGTARLADVEMPIAPLWDPATIALDTLPFLAWAFSVDSWNPDWPEPVKRQAVAESIALHRVKGTRASVDTILGRFDQLARIVEWHEASPRAAPHTFEIILPISGVGIEPGGERASAAFAETIIREVSRVKPLREHFVLVQALALAGGIGIQAVARSVTTLREDMALTIDASQPWLALLQDENGEPLTDDTGNYLDTTP